MPNPFFARSTRQLQYAVRVESADQNQEAHYRDYDQFPCTQVNGISNYCAVCGSQEGAALDTEKIGGNQNNAGQGGQTGAGMCLQRA